MVAQDVLRLGFKERDLGEEGLRGKSPYLTKEMVNRESSFHGPLCLLSQ